MKHTTSANYTLPIDGMGVWTNLASYCKSTSQNDCEGNHIVLSENHKECKACCARSRYTSAGTKRKPLSDLSENSINVRANGEKTRRIRPPRTRYGCSKCKIHLCQFGPCWQEHIKAKPLERHEGQREETPVGQGGMVLPVFTGVRGRGT